METSRGQNFTFESSTLSNRSRPVIQSADRTQSLTRHDDYRRIRQHPKSLAVFVPSDTRSRGETTITRSYEYELEEKRSHSSPNNVKPLRRDDFNIGREYRRCLNDLTDEYEKLQRQQNRRQSNVTYETTDEFQSVEQMSYRRPTAQNLSSRFGYEDTYQRSLSEGLLHQRRQPLVSRNVAISEDELTKMEYRLQPKERLKPIHIHSSNTSIPGQTSVKYVQTERTPVEVRLPKPQIFSAQGEHSSTIFKDVQQSTRRITTNIHQPQRRKTIEGVHELRIIEQPIAYGRSQPVEFTVPKPVESAPVEHSSTFVVKSRKGGRFNTLDISQSLGSERTLAGEHELRIVEEPIRSNSYNQPVQLVFPKLTYPTSSSHHSSTVVKQTRAPISSLRLDHIQTMLQGEHELRLFDRPIQAGPAESVELIVPKSVTETAEHTSTILTETQPRRRVLEIVGSGRTMPSEHERTYFLDTVRVEETVEVKLPKHKRPHGDHSATIVKHSRGQQPIIDIDTSRSVMQGEHEMRILNESIETRADAMHLLIAKPQQPAEHSTTVVKGQRGQSQRIALGNTSMIPGRPAAFATSESHRLSA